LWERLEREGRLVFDENRESNVDFLMPYEQVVAMWRKCITQAYTPEFIYERFAYNLKHTYPNRIRVPNSPARTSWANIIKGLRLMCHILVKVGLWSDYRETFWQFAKLAWQQGHIEYIISTALVSHHLIKFARECAQGKESASFYSQKVRQPVAVTTSY